MKKIISKLITFFPLLFLFGCKTPPVQKTILTITKSEQKLPSSQIKIYFPQFPIYNDKKKKTEIVRGDGTIVILPNNQCMIIDCFDPEAAEDMVKFVKSLGITKIDYLIATHYHADHIGGMPGLINNFEIGKFYSNGVDFNSGICRNFLALLNEKQIPVNVLKQGDSLILSEAPDECKIEVLWPNFTEEQIYNAYHNPGRTEKLKNNSSLVFKMIYNDFTVLFTGDVYKEGDKALTKQYGSKLKSTILKVPHHGEFYTSNSPVFVKTVAADIGVILDPSYMWNYVITVIYRNAKTKLLYRNTPGFILIESDGYDYKVYEESF